MKKHNFYLTLGLGLAVFGFLIAAVVPWLDGVHGAGIGLAIAGLIERSYLPQELR